jgi:hypothetical protein
MKSVFEILILLIDCRSLSDLHVKMVIGYSKFGNFGRVASPKELTLSLPLSKP